MMRKQWIDRQPDRNDRDDETEKGRIKGTTNAEVLEHANLFKIIHIFLPLTRAHTHDQFER